MVRSLGIAAVVVMGACTARPPALGEGARSGDGRGPVGVAVAAVDAAPAADAGDCRHDGDPLAEATLRAGVATLAAPALAGRAAGTDGDRQARAHVVARFRCLGLVPAGEGGGFEQAFVAAERHSANVIGYLPGGDPDVGAEIVVVGAHLDHLGVQGDELYLGANDNASGITAMLAIAQHVAGQDSAPRRTIAFIAFGDEESGLVGSRFYVAHPTPALPLDKVVQMINLDMVGSYGSRDAVYALGSFRGLPARTALDALLPSYPGLTVKRGGKGSGSDHQPFCRRGIPYIFFWTPDDRCYHQPCDTADAVDYANMTRITALAADLTLALAATTVDLAASRTTRGCPR